MPSASEISCGSISEPDTDITTTAAEERILKSEATYSIGTLDGRLNRAQTKHVIGLLSAAHPRAIFDMVTVADPSSNRRSSSELFTAHSPSELDVLLERLIDGEYQLLDIAAEDMVRPLPNELVIAAVPSRGTPYDALLHKGGLIADDLPEGTRVGVLSLRSQAQIAAIWPSLRPKLIYGGAVSALDSYLQNDQVDALVLPATQAELLGVQDIVSEIFFPEMMLPGAGQGTIIILARKNDEDTIAMAKDIHSEASYREVLAELAFRERICSDQDCPVGVLAQAGDEEMILTGAIGSPSGSSQDQAVLRGDVLASVELGQRLAERLLVSRTSLVDLLEADFPDGLPDIGPDDEDEYLVQDTTLNELDESALENLGVDPEPDIDIPDDDPLDDFAEPRDDY